MTEKKVWETSEIKELLLNSGPAVKRGLAAVLKCDGEAKEGKLDESFKLVEKHRSFLESVNGWVNRGKFTLKQKKAVRNILKTDHYLNILTRIANNDLKRQEVMVNYTKEFNGTARVNEVDAPRPGEDLGNYAERRMIEEEIAANERLKMEKEYGTW